MYSIYLYGILWHEKTPIVVGLSLGSGFGILGPGRRNRSGRWYCYSWHPRAGPVRSNGAQRMTTRSELKLHFDKKHIKKPTDLSLVIKPVLPWVDRLLNMWKYGEIKRESSMLGKRSPSSKTSLRSEFWWCWYLDSAHSAKTHGSIIGHICMKNWVMSITSTSEKRTKGEKIPCFAPANPFRKSSTPKKQSRQFCGWSSSVKDFAKNSRIQTCQNGNWASATRPRVSRGC